MARLPQQANSADNNQTMDDRTPVPAGDYNVHATKSEFLETKAKDGHRLVFTFQIIDGDHKGKNLFAGLNLNNPNSEAVAIAQKELNSICQACNKVGVVDSDELHLIPITVTVKIKPATAQWPAGNEISAYKAMTAAAPVAAPQPIAQPAPVAPQPIAPATPVAKPVAPVANPVPVEPAPVQAAPVAPPTEQPAAPATTKLPWE